jgi:hypothetical protein
MKKTEVLQIRLSPEKKRLYETRAGELGLTLTKFAEDAADVWAGLDMEFHKTIKGASAMLGISESSFTGMILTDWRARKVAEAGRYDRGLIFDEVVASDQGFLTGKPLFDARLERHKAGELVERGPAIESSPVKTEPLANKELAPWGLAGKESFDDKWNDPAKRRWLTELRQIMPKVMADDSPTVTDGHSEPES